MAQNLYYILFLLLTLSYQSHGKNEGNLLGETLVKEAIKSVRPSLTKVHISNRNEFETGPQEFGNFKGYIEDVVIEGLDGFNVTVFNISDLTINNITFTIEKLTVKSKYDLNGTLAFPLGRTDIHMFGNGQLRAIIKKLSFSLKLELDLENEMNKIKNLDLDMDYQNMTINLSNLMRTKELEKVFNKFLCDINKTIFDYYKLTVLSYMKEEVENIILQILNPKSTIKEEL